MKSHDVPKVKKMKRVPTEISLLVKDLMCAVIYRIYKYDFEKKIKINYRNVSFNEAYM